VQATTLVSLGIIGHFAAIAIAVTSLTTGTFPAPMLAISAGHVVRPYLNLTHLANPYRFFAPNPSAVSLLWFRVHRADGTLHWTEWPDPAARWRGMAYQRRLSVPFQLGAQLAPSLRDPGLVLIGAGGREYVAALARYVARTAGGGAPPDEVRVYHVTHRLLMPYEIQMGWEPTDLRLYQPIVFLGSYDPRGEPIARPTGDRLGAVVPPSVFASRVIREAVSRMPGPGGSRAGGPGPQPVRELLDRFPEIRPAFGQDEGQLRLAIERAIVGRDRPDQVRDPARRAYEQELRRAPPGGS
jgi:hypothetical protein